MEPALALAWSIRVGVSSFLRRLEYSFLNELDGKDIPHNLDPKDGETSNAWLDEAFANWLLEHRDELMAKEWAKRGWVQWTPKPLGRGTLKESYQVNPDCVDQIDAWLQDEID
jgi:hypothetical protein